MICLADTVTVIRYFSETGRIGRKAKTILDAAEHGRHHIYVSVISMVEIMYLSEKRRIKIDLAETQVLLGNSTNYSVVDLTPDIVAHAGDIKFPELHDRLIIATANYLKIPILTSDERIREIDSVEVIWDGYYPRDASEKVRKKTGVFLTKTPGQYITYQGLF